MKVAIYARYSSDLQKCQSIEDQIRICREAAQLRGWHIVDYYTDAALSGASMKRPGLQKMMQDAADGKIEAILTEALDRLSRDQADMATIYKRTQFYGVKIVTLSEGNVGLTDVGLKGLMNHLYLVEMKQKVLRGQRGRAENGKIPAGLCYGYDVVRRFDDKGQPVRGERSVNPEQAKVIRRIFEEYDAGKSPRAIAADLNKEGIPGPTGKHWAASTIRGRLERATGILANPNYVGKILWNRLREDKEPDTLRRIPRINPREQWVEGDAPHLRIIEQDLWDRVQMRLKELSFKQSEVHKANRPKHLLSGLLVCGECGGGFTKRTPDRYGCTNHRDGRGCKNQLRIKQTDIEEAVLGSLGRYFMQPKLLKLFCEEFTKRTNELRREVSANVVGYKAEITKLERARKRCIEAIKNGVPGEEVKDEMIAIRERRLELEALLEATADDPVRLHPRMADHYKAQISDLIYALREETSKDVAKEILRGLIDKVVLSPDEGRKKLIVDLYGDLAGILDVAESHVKTPAKRRVGERVMAVVGPEGLEPPT